LILSYQDIDVLDIMTASYQVSYYFVWLSFDG